MITKRLRDIVVSARTISAMAMTPIIKRTIGRILAMMCFLIVGIACVAHAQKRQTQPQEKGGTPQAEKPIDGPAKVDPTWASGSKVHMGPLITQPESVPEETQPPPVFFSGSKSSLEPFEPLSAPTPGPASDTGAKRKPVFAPGSKAAPEPFVHESK